MRWNLSAKYVYDKEGYEWKQRLDPDISANEHLIKLQYPIAFPRDMFIYNFECITGANEIVKYLRPSYSYGNERPIGSESVNDWMSVMIDNRLTDIGIFVSKYCYNRDVNEWVFDVGETEGMAYIIGL